MQPSHVSKLASFTFLAALGLSGAFAGTVFVDSNATGPLENGQTWCSAYRDLQDALAVAQPVTAPDFWCVDAYVRQDGTLGTVPVFQSTLDWQSVEVRGAQILPNMRLNVQAIFEGGSPGDTAEVTTYARGDAVGSFVDGAWLPPDGVVAAVDAVACLDRFRSSPSAPPIARCDFLPHVPDGILDITDIVEIIDAFRDRPNDLPGPCE